MTDYRGEMDCGERCEQKKGGAAHRSVEWLQLVREELLRELARSRKDAKGRGEGLALGERSSGPQVLGDRIQRQVVLGRFARGARPMPWLTVMRRVASGLSLAGVSVPPEGPSQSVTQASAPLCSGSL